MEFPRLVYKSASLHELVKNEEEFSSALERGFFASVPESVIGIPASAKPVLHEIKDNAPPTRDEIEVKAKELGLKFDGRTSDAKLLKLIDAAVKE